MPEDQRPYVCLRERIGLLHKDVLYNESLCMQSCAQQAKMLGVQHDAGSQYATCIARQEFSIAS